MEDEVKISRYKENGNEIVFITDKTPFYAESGGQAGDCGTFVNADLSIDVIDTVKWNNMIIHKGSIPHNVSADMLSNSFKASVDKQKRADVRRNHSATHLLHAALRNVLGKHVQQSGSRVARNSLRFDFVHFKALTKEELEKIENLVNTQIRNNLSVSTQVSGLEEAKKSGAMALFGEKYEDKVRVVVMDAFSRELCGGTHVSATGEIGAFHIVNEESIASGVRRIEAITGERFMGFFREKVQQLNDISRMLKVPSDKIVERLEKELKEKKSLEKELNKTRENEAIKMVDEIIKSPKKIRDIGYVAKQISGMDKNAFEKTGDAVAVKIKDLRMVVALAATINGKVSLICSVSDSLTKKPESLHAGNLIKQIAAVTGGGGGGKSAQARAGGRDVSKIKEALELVPKILENYVSGRD